MTTSKEEYNEDAIYKADDEKKIQHDAKQIGLEEFINVPGLQHLAENIFVNLKYQDLEACRSVKGSFQHFLDLLMENSSFWLEKFVLRGMSKKNAKYWPL